MKYLFLVYFILSQNGNGLLKPANFENDGINHIINKIISLFKIS